MRLSNFFGKISVPYGACAACILAILGASTATAQTSSPLTSPFGTAAEQPTKPPKDLIVQDAAYTPTQINRAAHLLTSTRWGQSFTAQNSGTIAKIELRVIHYCPSNMETTPSDVILTVRRGMTATGPILLSTQVPASAFATTCGEVTLSAEVSPHVKKIVAGKTYTIFATLGGTNPDEVAWRGGDDGYSGGSIIDALDGVGIPDTGGDFIFSVSTQVKE